MPNYYNPGLFYPATYTNPYTNPYINGNAMMQQPLMSGTSSTMQYMINVDGEGSARAWQPAQPLGPNTIIPLWDLDGIHLYFKSTDAYGRMNPIRKARVVFEDDQQTLPQGQSGSTNPQLQSPPENQSQPTPTIDMSQYVTKEDFESLRQDIHSMRNMLSQKNRNERNNVEQNNLNRGDK